MAKKCLTRRDSLVVPADQADYLFLQSMLEKRTKFEENVFYDVSAWTMPLAFGMKHHELSRVISRDQLERARIGQKSPQALAVSENDIAYLIDWRDDRAAFWVNRLLEREYLVKVATKSLTVGSDESTVAFAPGTCLVALGQQTKSHPQLMAILQRASADGVRIVPGINWTDARRNRFGEQSFRNCSTCADCHVCWRWSRSVSGR